MRQYHVFAFIPPVSSINTSVAETFMQIEIL